MIYNKTGRPPGVITTGFGPKGLTLSSLKSQAQKAYAFKPEQIQEYRSKEVEHEYKRLLKAYSDDGNGDVYLAPEGIAKLKALGYDYDNLQNPQEEFSGTHQIMFAPRERQMATQQH